MDLWQQAFSWPCSARHNRGPSAVPELPPWGHAALRCQHTKPSSLKESPSLLAKPNLIKPNSASHSPVPWQVLQGSSRALFELSSPLDTTAMLCRVFFFCLFPVKFTLSRVPLLLPGPLVATSQGWHQAF